jgi:hypothetical protein
MNRRWPRRQLRRALPAAPRKFFRVHAASTCLGQHLSGFNRTQEYAARNRREEYDRLYAEPETVTLSPLPCWRELPEAIRRQRIAEMVEDIEADGAMVRIAMMMREIHTPAR